MVLQGLKDATFLGWTFGVLLIKSPKGVPEPAVRKSPFTVFLLILFFLNLLIRFDFYMTHTINLKGQSMVEKFLVLSLLVGESCFDCYFRANLVLRSKLVIRFLKTLETDMKKFAPTLQLPDTDRKEWVFSERLVWSTLIFHFTAGAFTTYWASYVLAWSSSKSGGFLILRVLPETLYAIIFYFLGEVPVICSISVAFSIVIVCTFHVLWIFYDFCESLDQQIGIHNAKADQDLSFAKHHLGELDFSLFSVAANALQQQRQKQEPLGTDKLIGKLEHLKLVCGLYDKVCGPLVLGLIVRAVYVLISTANSILLYENPDGSLEKTAKHYLDMFLFPTEIIQLWLLPLGTTFKRKVPKSMICMHYIIALE